MAPTYVQTSTRSAWFGGIFSVSVVMSATPIVAVSPGSAPIDHANKARAERP